MVRCDVGDDEAVGAAVAGMVERHGRIDAVVNAAGVFACGRTLAIPAEVFDAVVRTNLLGSANVARAVLPVLRQQGGGVLVLVGSLLGHVTAPYIAPYAVSKWGVRALARVLVAETRDADGVRIGYIAPAGVDTPIYQRAANYLGRELRAPRPLTPVDVVARDILDQVDGRSRPGLAAPLPRLLHLAGRVGFKVLPARWFDATAAALVRVDAVDRTRVEEPGPGAVLEPVS